MTLTDARRLIASPAPPKTTSKRPNEIGDGEAALLRDGRIVLGRLPAAPSPGSDEGRWLAAMTFPNSGGGFMVERLAGPLERVRLASLIHALTGGFDFGTCTCVTVPAEPTRNGGPAADFAASLGRLWPELADAEDNGTLHKLHVDDDAIGAALKRWREADSEFGRYELRPAHTLNGIGGGHLIQVIPADAAGEKWWVRVSLPDHLDPDQDGSGCIDIWNHKKPVLSDAVPYVVESMAPGFDAESASWVWTPREPYIRQTRGEVPSWEDRPPEFRGDFAPEG